jgi:SAM-dependent methyltransferase
VWPERGQAYLGVARVSRAWDKLALELQGHHDPPGSLPARLHGYLRSLVLRELEHLPLGAVVLDLGCGRGDLASELARRRPDLKVLGMDASPAMLSFAAKAAPSRDNPQWILGDATCWPLPDASVDAVAALDLLAHLAPEHELPALFREAKRVCKGSLYVELKTPWSLRLILALRRAMAGQRLASLRSRFLGWEAASEPIPIFVHPSGPWLTVARVKVLRIWPYLPAPSAVHVIQAIAIPFGGDHA